MPGQNSSALEEVHRASLKIFSRMRIGFNDWAEYKTALGGLAYEMALASDQPLSKGDTAALRKYSEALDVLIAVPKVWAVNDTYHRCLDTYSSGNRAEHCREIYMYRAKEVATQAQISPDAVFDDHVLDTAWAVATQKVQMAESIRRDPFAAK